MNPTKKQMYTTVVSTQLLDFCFLSSTSAISWLFLAYAGQCIFNLPRSPEYLPPVGGWSLLDTFNKPDHNTITHKNSQAFLRTSPTLQPAIFNSEHPPNMRSSKRYLLLLAGKHSHHQCCTFWLSCLLGSEPKHKPRMGPSQDMRSPRQIL